MPGYEWDDAKRLRNIEIHQIDFEDSWLILGNEFLASSGHPGRDGERRHLAIGPLDDVLVTVVYTIRGGNFRIISMRRAHRKERDAFHGAIHRG